jgi:hypothetical protein
VSKKERWPFRPFNTPFHDAANEIMVSTYTGGKENARANGYERHPILLRNAIADALKAAYLAGKRSRSKGRTK